MEDGTESQKYQDKQGNKEHECDSRFSYYAEPRNRYSSYRLTQYIN
jgi:hypothetical protein